MFLKYVLRGKKLNNGSSHCVFCWMARDLLSCRTKWKILILQSHSTKTKVRCWSLSVWCSPSLHNSYVLSAAAYEDWLHWVIILNNRMTLVFEGTGSICTSVPQTWNNLNFFNRVFTVYWEQKLSPGSVTLEFVFCL